MSAAYYSNVNPDLLALVPAGASTVIEVGAGEGHFGAAYLRMNPRARYIGIELTADAAQQARGRLTQVIHGNIESPATSEELDQALNGTLADVLVFGDALPNLRDPWAALESLRRRIRPGGTCVACIPNVSHWSLIEQQLKGEWTYTDSGLLDRTHLRFFTLNSARAMFQSAGWQPADATPRVLWPDKTEKALKALAPAAHALGIDEDRMRRDLSAFQWVIRSVNGPSPQTLNVAGLGLRKFAAVTEARVDFPLTALRSLPGVQAVWAAQTLSMPRHWSNGVLLLHRNFLNSPEIIQVTERLAARGWLLVSDMDDDPHHWEAYVASDFRAFRGVHAVTVATQPLAHLMRQWNPEVAVLPNGIMRLPDVPPSCPKGATLRVFFGALNRQADWKPLEAALREAALVLKDVVQWVVVHDEAFFNMLPAEVGKQFHGTLGPEEYLQAMAQCDVSLLPLQDTPFNRLKSDLKFIESCAAGVVPICSPVVYSAKSDHLDIGCFAVTPEQWREALIGLCGNVDQLAQRRARGFEYVTTQRMHGAMAASREAVYRDWLARQPELEQARRQRLADRGIPLTPP